VARLRLEQGDRLVVKVGTASLVGSDGRPDVAKLESVCAGLASARAAGIDVIFVSSGAIAAGLAPLGLAAKPSDIPSLQAAAAVGQGHLLGEYTRLLAGRGILGAQVLLTRYDFMHRQQYLNARHTLDRLLQLGAVPIVNENDTVAVDEIRFGDNDRLAALVANLARAKLLLLLTDARGVHSADPRRFPDAPIVDEVKRITPELERAAGGRGSDLSSGGMASKLSAAWVATFSGVGVVVAGGSGETTIPAVVAGERVGTYFHPHPTRETARRLWIAFAQPPKGTVVVDHGARNAVVRDRRSLLPVGVVEVRGHFASGDTVDVAEREGVAFARGLVRYASEELDAARGRSTAELAGREVIHRDQLVVLEDGR
jgi:glutamate 5-kinase